MQRNTRTGIARIARIALAVIAFVALTAPVAATDTATTLPAQTVAVGQTVSFTGSGFDPGERISLWTTAPSGTPAALDGVTAATDGSFATTVSFPSDGYWQVTAQGNASARQVIGGYNVGTSGTSGTSGGGNLAPVTPGSTTVAIGQTVTFTGTGFNANELVSVWTTAPDSQTAALPGVSADASGAVALSVSFPSAGYWQVTAQGLSSNVQSISGYTVGSSASGGVAPPSPAAGMVAVGRNATFTASGYQPGETVAIWTTAPDGTPAALPGGTADTAGRITLTTAFPTPGYWQITAQGITSGVQKIVGYTVTG